MITISTLSKSYAARTLFDDVSFSINSGEKLGLVGRNGEGKSTFFRLLTREEEPDGGRIAFPSGYRVGHLSQHLQFEENTALDAALAGLEEEARWTDAYKVEGVLEGLGFSAEQLKADPKLLSGGYQVRLNLVKLLASEPDLLLLDEPTNYLDIISLRWLGRFLRDWPREVILITHDHGFMNEMITHTLGIHRAGIRKIAGPTHKYYAQLALEEEVHEKSRLNQEKKIKETEKFINTFRAKASKAKAVQSRVKELEKMEKLSKLDEIQNLDFRFTHTPFHGKRVIEFQNVSFAWERGSPLISKLSFAVNPKDRIGIIGKNGKGKTTLLRLLVSEIKPTDGDIKVSPGMKLAYFGQTNVERLSESKSIEEELLAMPEVDNRTQARSAAGLMMFQGDQALKKISVLSGGEKSRVLLAKNLLTPANILFLDEPTNHLDMYSTDALLKAVKDFPGAVAMVTHSQMFLREVANRLIIFDRGEVRLFEGSYDDFLSSLGWQEEDELELASPNVKKSGNAKRFRELKKEYARLEKKIEKKEAAIAEQANRLVEITTTGFGIEAEKLSTTIESNKQEVAKLYQALETTITELDSESS